MSDLGDQANHLERILAARRALAAHDIMYGGQENTRGLRARLAASERELARVSEELDEAKRELIRMDTPKRLRVVKEA